MCGVTLNRLKLPPTADLFPLCVGAMKHYLEKADDSQVPEAFSRLGSDFEV